MDPACGDLLQGSADLFIKRAALLVGPALLSLQSIQSAADYVLGIREPARGQPLFYQSFNIGRDGRLHA
jgi:hypothetical protein